MKRKQVEFKQEKKNDTLWMWIIIGVGMALRLWLATGKYNFDIISYMKDVELFMQGKNIYLHQTAYNYTPIFYWFIGIVGWIQHMVPVVSFPFFVRAVLSCVDLATLFVLLHIASLRQISRLKTAVLFFLNPVSITLTGIHGQFDNLALFFVVLALYLWERGKNSSAYAIKSWALLTVAIIVKQMAMFAALPAMLSIFRYKKQAVLAIVISGILFLCTFLPYLSGALPRIQHQVFRYGGLQGFYGLTYTQIHICSLYSLDCKTVEQYMQYVFLAIYMCFILFVRIKDTLRASLFYTLVFLTFTSGISAQYFILPIALGALFPTKWFFMYSIVTFLFFLGYEGEYNIPMFTTFTWNTVWIFAGLWFVSEWLRVSPRLQDLYEKLFISRKTMNGETL